MSPCVRHSWAKALNRKPCYPESLRCVACRALPRKVVNDAATGLARRARVQKWLLAASGGTPPKFQNVLQNILQSTPKYAPANIPAKYTPKYAPKCTPKPKTAKPRNPRTIKPGSDGSVYRMGVETVLSAAATQNQQPTLKRSLFCIVGL